MERVRLQTQPGYWKFLEPSEILAEFLVPFEEFTKLNQLEAAVPQILTVSGVGYGGVRELFTFDIFQASGSSITKGKLLFYTLSPAIQRSCGKPNS
jgi:hypothetical protein